MYLVITTLPKDFEINFIVEENLAWCIFYIDWESVYRWNWIVKDQEKLVLIKTLNKDLVIKRLKEIHPYNIPFIATLQVEVNLEYLNWLQWQ